MIHGEWRQTGGGGGTSVAGAVVAALVVILGSGIILGIAEAVAEIIVWLVVAFAIFAAAVIAGAVAYVMHRRRHPAAESRYSRIMQPRMFQLSEPEPRAVKATAPAAIEQHVHFHVNDVADVAEILRRQQAPE